MDAGSWTQEEAVEFLQNVDQRLLRRAATLLDKLVEIEAMQEISDLADVIDSFDWSRLLAEHVETMRVVPHVEADEEWLGTIAGRTRVYFDLEQFPEPPPPLDPWDSYYDEPADIREGEEFWGSGGYVRYEEYEEWYEVGW